MSFRRESSLNWVSMILFSTSTISEIMSVMRSLTLVQRTGSDDCVGETLTDLSFNRTSLSWRRAISFCKALGDSK